MHWAAERQHLAVVAALVECGADTNIKDNLGYTPVQIARWHGEYRMCAYTETCLAIVKCLTEARRNPEK